MLVLSRKSGEEILIDGCIEIKILKICGNRVQIGITAADDIRIERPEAMQKEGRPEFSSRMICELVAS